MDKLYRDFSFRWEKIDLTAELLILVGALDRSINFERDPRTTGLLNQFRERIKSKSIYIDVNELDFWDTEGIRFVFESVIAVALKGGAKISIFGNKSLAEDDGEQRETQIYKDACIKSDFMKSGKVPWTLNLERKTSSDKS